MLHPRFVLLRVVNDIPDELVDGIVRRLSCVKQEQRRHFGCKGTALQLPEAQDERGGRHGAGGGVGGTTVDEIGEHLMRRLLEGEELFGNLPGGRFANGLTLLPVILRVSDDSGENRKTRHLCNALPFPSRCGTACRRTSICHIRNLQRSAWMRVAGRCPVRSGGCVRAMRKIW